MSITKISPSVVDFDAGITITTDDNSNNLTITSTDADASNGPNIKFHRNSGSPADNDYGGYILFNAENDASEDTAFSYIGQQLIDVSDGTEDGRLFIYNMQGGTSVNAIDVLPTETVFNEGSVDRDFRVESDGNANALVINGGNNNVGIGADPLASYAGYTTLYVGGNTNFMSNTAAEASSSVNYSHNAQFDTDGSWEYIATDEASNYYQAGGGHYFRVAASGSAGADITWVNGPSIDVNGNLVFPSGKGIDFSATSNSSGSMSSELLDDYEEGTWTPGIQATTGNSIESGTTSGRYIKIGKQVIATIFLNNHANNTFGSGNLAFTNLPFTCVNANAQTSPTPIMTRYIDPPSGAFQLHTYVGGGETIAYLYWSTTGNWAIATGNDVNTDGSWAVYASCIYEVA